MYDQFYHCLCKSVVEINSIYSLNPKQKCLNLLHIVVDLVSAPFKMDRIHLYENYEDPTNFFRPSLRSLLVSIIILLEPSLEREIIILFYALQYTLKKGIHFTLQYNAIAQVVECSLHMW